MIHIQVDIRERDLIPRIDVLLTNKNMDEKNKNNKITMSKQNLAIGDIILTLQNIEDVNKEKEDPSIKETNDNSSLKELIIIERKTVADLMSSIKDGRYDEQSYRLSGYDACPNHNIIYLIEGAAKTRFKNETERTIFNSAIFSILYYKGFSVMYSNSLDDTAYIVCNMADKMQREMVKQKKTPYYSNIFVLSDVKKEKLTNLENDEKKEEENYNVNNTLVPSYCSVVKKVKKENINVENIATIMLSQIPGVSYVIAMAICDVYKTIPQLVLAVRENAQCLDGFCISDSGKKSRKISKSVIAKIVEYLGK